MLFTVTATFSDFTNSVHQYEAISADDAVRTFVATLEALAAYDKTEWFAKAPDNVVLTHAAGMRGVWLWHPTIELAQEGIALAVARLFKQILQDRLVFGFRGSQQGDKEARSPNQ